MNPDQPNPTTGEWTAEMVEATLKDRPFAASTIASNHNAAVKEAYQKGYEDGKQAR